MKRIIILVLIGLYTVGNTNEIVVVDDWQRSVSLDHPPQRIVTLAPHLSELVYSAGGGDRLVGVSEHSDYPPQARTLPVVADYRTYNRELLVKLSPDLILVWGVMLKQPIFRNLNTTGYTFYISQPDDFEDIAKTLEDIGILLGETQKSTQLATEFRQSLQSYRRTVRAEHKTAYLLWLKPTLSINRDSWMSKAIDLCGGINIYADLQPQVVRLGREVLLSSKPNYIIHSFESGITEENDNSFVRRQNTKLLYQRGLDTTPFLAHRTGR